MLIYTDCLSLGRASWPGLASALPVPGSRLPSAWLPRAPSFLYQFLRPQPAGGQEGPNASVTRTPFRFHHISASICPLARPVSAPGKRTGLRR